MILYTLKPSTRRAKPNGSVFPVKEIYVDGELVGAFWSGDGHLFGEVTDPDGHTYPHGDCTRDDAGAEDFMVGMIMRHRQVGDCPDWRGLAAGVVRLDAQRID